MQIQMGRCSCGFVGVVGDCPGPPGLLREGCEVSGVHNHCARCSFVLKETWSVWDIRTSELEKEPEEEKISARNF